jgi:quercetin dioxygenase-like cupin family protein
MPIIKRQNMTKAKSSAPGVDTLRLIDAEHGSLSLRVGEATLSPGGQVPTHIHPNTEEAMVVLEGNIEAILGDQKVNLGPGDSMLAPAGTVHGCRNRHELPAKLISMFPTQNVEREAVELPE